MTSLMTGSLPGLSHALPPPLVRGAVSSSSKRSKTLNGIGSISRPSFKYKQKWALSLRPTDVLFGRGCGPSSNEGNIFYRHLVTQRKHQYKNSKTREEKNRIATEIFNAIQARGGRFLRDGSNMDRKHFDIPESIQVVWIVVDKKTCLDKIKQALRQKVVYKDSSREESYLLDAHVGHETLHWPEVNQGHSEESWTLFGRSNILPSVQGQLTSEDAHEEQLEPLDWREQNNQDLSDLACTLLESDSKETMPSQLSSPLSSEDDHEDEDSLEDWTFEEIKELTPASGLAFDQNIFEG